MGALVGFGLIAFGLIVFGILALVLVFLKLIVWLIWLPIRALIAVPIFLMKLVVGVAFGVVLLPILAVGLFLALLVTAFAVLLPLAPFVLLALLVWALAKRGQPRNLPAAPAR